MEMCCASGRDTLLKPPNHYSVPLPPADPEASSDKGPTGLISVMVSFADILRAASDDLYSLFSIKPLAQLSRTAFELDDALEQWRHNLPPMLMLDEVSLRDPEWLSKQKVVLKLRYWNARIILHRQLLMASAAHDSEAWSKHIAPCLEASHKTIQLLYDTYLHRNYFRTWWYNTTYLLYASMIILYVIPLRHCRADDEDLIGDVEKSLEILKSMDVVHVPHGCAQLISEVLEITKQQISSRKVGPELRTSAYPAVAPFAPPIPNPGGYRDRVVNPDGEISGLAQAGPSEGDHPINPVDFNFALDLQGFPDLDTILNDVNQMHMQSIVPQPCEIADGIYPHMGSGDFLRGGEDGVLSNVSPGMDSEIFGPSMHF